jgi:chaperonin GroEL (HSP60 family)
MLSMESVISQKIKRTKGKDVWRENLRLAVFAADKVRSTLGPKGAYKLVAYNRGPEQVVKVTKDAVAILEELAIQYPPAVIVSESAKLHRQEAGDGVAGFVIFLSALLKKADDLLTMGIHANTIIHGYHLATEKSLEIFERQAALGSQNSDVLDVVDCQRNLLTPKVRSMIRQAYPTAFSGGIFEQENVRFLKKKGGELQDSSLISGVVIKKQKAHPNMPDSLRNLRIVVTSGRLGTNRLEVKMKGEGPVHIHLNIKTPQQIQGYIETDNKLKTQHIEKLAKLKVNVLLCEQPLEAIQKDKLVAEGIFALEGVDKKDTLAVSRATGAKTVASLNELNEEDIGYADALSTGKIELENTVTIDGCRGATFMLRGSTPQTLDEFETAIKNSFVVLKLTGDDGRVLPGGGASEAQVAEELRGYARTFAGREQMVVESFADALMDIPRCLAENYGLNPTDTILELRKRHADGFCSFGVNSFGCRDLVCQEPLKVKRSTIRRAYEVSTLMLRIDELLMSKEIPKFHKQ